MVSGNLVTLPDFPAPGIGLTSVFPIMEASQHDITHGVYWESDSCNVQLSDVSYESCIRSAAKTFNEGLLFGGSEATFSLYHAMRCQALGLGGEQAQMDRARRRFLLGESAALEKHLHTSKLSTGFNVSPETGGPVSVTVGVSLLFQALGTTFVPVIHAPRAVGVELAKDDTVAKAGGKLVLGAGYPTNGDGTAFIYGTGPVMTWATPEVDTVVFTPKENQMYALAERNYIQGVECGVYRVQVRFAPDEVNGPVPL